MRLVPRLFSIGAGITLLLILLISYASVQQANRKMQQDATDHLRSVVMLKQDQLREFLRGELRNLREVADNPQVIVHLSSYHDPANGTQAEHPGIEILGELFRQSYQYSDFIDLMLVLPDGQVEVSAVPEQEREFVDYKEYVEAGTDDEMIRFSAIGQRHRLIIAAPVLDAHGQEIGTVVAFANLTTVSGIMTQRTGLGATGDTYLLNNEGLALTELRFDPGAAYTRTLATDAALACRSGQSDSGIYPGYNGPDVVGVYGWMDDLNICVVAEQELGEIRMGFGDLLGTIIWICMLTIMAVLISIILFLRGVVKPIVTLQTAADRIGKGDFTVTYPAESDDELGAFTRSFKSMVADLQKAHDDLEQHAQVMEERVKNRTSSLLQKIDEAEKTRLALLNILEDVDRTNKELVKTKSKLEETVKELRLMDKKKDEIISVTAHELKTPLTSIQGFVALLNNPKILASAPKRERIISIISQDTGRLGKLISDILDLSRLDMESITFTITRFSLADMAKEITNEIDAYAAEYHVQLKRIMTGDDFIISSDKDRLKQIIINLLTNAIKYSKEHDEVLLKISEAKQGFTFTIIDHGIGMDKTTQEHIFERFYQGDSSYTRKVGGAGLGLSIVKEFTQRLGGKVDVTSVPGKGSTFRLFFPKERKASRKDRKGDTHGA